MYKTIQQNNPINWDKPQGKVNSIYPPKDTTTNQIHSALVSLKQQLQKK